MSGNGKYRWPTIVVAGTALTLAAFCIWFEFAAYNDYRSRDFTLASGGLSVAASTHESGSPTKPPDASVKSRER